MFQLLRSPTPTHAALDDPWWAVMDWAEKFAAWEVVANFTATLIATAFGVWIAVTLESRRSRQRERQSVIRRGIALADEAERYPDVAPIDDVSVMAVAFPLWLNKDQLASDLNEVTPNLGAWVLWRLRQLHRLGSEDLSAFETRAIADEVRDALRGELKRSKSSRPVGWYSEVLKREQIEFAAQFVAKMRRTIQSTRARIFPDSATLAVGEDVRRRRLWRTCLTSFRWRRKDRRR